jgi:hypothetical protein
MGHPVFGVIEVISRHDPPGSCAKMDGLIVAMPFTDGWRAVGDMESAVMRLKEREKKEEEATSTINLVQFPEALSAGTPPPSGL